MACWSLRGLQTYVAFSPGKLDNTRLNAKLIALCQYCISVPLSLTETVEFPAAIAGFVGSNL